MNEEPIVATWTVKKINVIDAITAISSKLSMGISAMDEVAKFYTRLYPGEEVIVVDASGAESERYKSGYRTQRVIVNIHHDTDRHDPSSAGGDNGRWTIYSFSNRWLSFKEPEEFGFFPGENGLIELGVEEALAHKFEVGLAFRLSYCQCSWFLQGQGGPYGFEGVRFAGVAIFEDEECPMGATTLEDRAKDCTGFLETYTAWCNGECYGYQVTTVGGEDVDSCWGFYGNDLEYMFAQIREATEGKTVVSVGGDASDLVQYHDIQKKEVREKETQ